MVTFKYLFLWQKRAQSDQKHWNQSGTRVGGNPRGAGTKSTNIELDYNIIVLVHLNRTIIDMVKPCKVF